MTEPRYYTVSEVAEQTRMGERFIRDAIREGRLRAVRMGRRQFVKPEALVEFIDANEGTPKRLKAVR